jgi:hypothetical protein
MEADIVSETLHYNSILARLIAPEDFIAFSHRESFESYTVDYDRKMILKRDSRGEF